MAAVADAPAAAVATDPKVARLRELLTTADDAKPIDAFIIPTEDPHMVRQCPRHLSALRLPPFSSLANIIYFCLTRT